MDAWSRGKEQGGGIGESAKYLFVRLKDGFQSGMKVIGRITDELSAWLMETGEKLKGTSLARR